MNQPVKKDKRERGIALILSLAMMTLLMVMAMAFSFSSRSELEVSTAFRDANLAKLNAMDAINTGLHHSQFFADRQTDPRVLLTAQSSPYVSSLLTKNGGYSLPVPNIDVSGNNEDLTTRRWNEYELCPSNDMSLYFTSGMEFKDSDKLKGLDQAGLDRGFNYRQGFSRKLLPPAIIPGGAPPSGGTSWFKDRIGWRHIRDWDDAFSFNQTQTDVVTTKALTRGGAIKGRSLWLASCESLKLDINSMLQEKYRAEEKDENGKKRGHLFSFNRLLEVMNTDVDSIKSDGKLQNKLSKVYKQSDLELRLNSRLMPWDSIEQLWNAQVFKVESDAQIFAGYFSTFGQNGDIEAYYEGNLYWDKAWLQFMQDHSRPPAMHRFYIADLATSTVQELWGLKEIKKADGTWELQRDSKQYPQKVGVETFWKDGVPGSTVNPDKTTSIQWLNKMGYRDRSIDKDSTQLKKPGKQVAANLIDYSDTNNTPTTNYDIAKGNPVDTPELYCGLEKVPFISSIKIYADSAETPKDPTKPSGTKVYSLGTVKATVTIMALYKGTQGGSGKITLYTDKGNVDTTITLPTTPGATETADIDIDSLVTKQGDLTETPSIIFTKLGLVLTNGGATIDLCRSDSNSTLTFKKATTSGNLVFKVGQLSGHIVFPDPRANTNINLNAVWVTPMTDAQVAGYHRPRSARSNYPDGKGRKKSVTSVDSEPTNSIKDISTLYIRNGIMKTHWELGAISRGEPFRTINLKRYSKSFTTPQYIPALHKKVISIRARSYVDGDALLCDQIKLRPDTFTAGKPNFSVPTGGKKYGIQAFNALARSLLKSPDGTYDLPSAGTTSSSKYAISDSVWNSTVHPSAGGAIWNQQLIANKYSFDRIGSRSKMAPYIFPNSVSGNNTDKQMEEVFGKLVDLFSSSSCHYQMIGTGEEVKHMEMSDAMSQRYENWQTTDPEKVPRNWVLIPNEGWYKILGRVKILCRLRRDLRTEQIKVLRQEIIND